jgi:hypothetical protein
MLTIVGLDSMKQKVSKFPCTIEFVKKFINSKFQVYLLIIATVRICQV